MPEQTYNWVVECVDASNRVFFAVGNDRTMMTTELRRQKVHHIGTPVRADLMVNFPQMTERFDANGFIYV